MQTTEINLAEINASLSQATPAEIVNWGLGVAQGSAIVSTNFRPLSAVTLHAVTRGSRDVPVLWVDTGHNTRATYRFAEKVIQDLGLNMRIYTPRMTTARWEALNGVVPSFYDEEPHRKFTQDVKIEPFNRALAELKPRVWFSGLRKVSNEHRGSLDIVTLDRGMIKISPVFHFTDADMEAYLQEHQLPDEKDYFDPTKVLDTRECGLHLQSGGL